ncbi:MAG TPA: BatA domain-containing protein [Planctomycetota bacterium]|nr:BatA domain-containing protein [Planctomycetota bacterium]
MFTTAWLAIAGAASSSIPIIIHLLNKQRYKKVVWGAMHWLWASFRKSRRRLQVEQLILLIVRTLILLLLGCALARPILGGLIFSGRPATHRVIVLDNSYSMGQLLGGRPLFEKAKSLAADLAGQMTASDELDVLLTGSGSADVSKEERLVNSKELLKKSETVNAINSATLGDGGTDLPRAIAAACKVIVDKKSKNARKEIIVITDSTRNAWLRPDQQPRKVEGADEAAIADAFSNPNTKPHIVVMRIPGDPNTDNFAASSIEIDEKVLPARVDKQLIGTINSFAAENKSGLNVKLKIDNEEVSTETMGNLTKAKPETVTFRYSFGEPGSHSVAIEVESGDILPNDNTAYLAVDVEDQLRVLCVDGAQRAGANASATDYLRQALSPSKSEELNAGKMPLFPKVIADSAFIEENLDDYRLIIFANVAGTIIPPEKIKALEQYVKAGGSLLIFVGDRVDPQIYNRDFDELLPMKLGEIVGGDDRDGPKETVNDKFLDHPAIAKFKGIKGLSLAQLQTFKRFKFVPRPKSDDVRVVLTYENDEPCAVERKVGDGRVIVFGTSADASWTRWPEKADYMPLMNFVALDLITPAYLQRNKLVGERFTLQIRRGDLGAARREGIRLTDPVGETSTMEINMEKSVAESEPLKRAGIYTAVIPGEQKRTLHFAVNRNIEESDLATIDDHDILAFIPHDAAVTNQPGFFKGVMQNDIAFVKDEVKSVEDAFSSKGASKEFWRFLAVAVLLLLLIESILARRFGDFNR